jgi:N-ethylmaleimide reductase
MNIPPILKPLNSSNLGVFKNRVVMSAMTRSFADKSNLCTLEIAKYYERRARGGVALILTEGIVIHPSGNGYNSVPHLFTQAQMESWKNTVELVHQHGSKIYAQLWHCGRISHTDFTSGYEVVSSTNAPADGINRQNNKPYGSPSRLLEDEIPNIYRMYIHSAKLAMKSGFDGVQIHMGHGYLVDQFFDARINDRTDKYGGSIENRCRFALELCAEVIHVIGADKVMIRLSPSRMMNGLYEWPDLNEMLHYLLPELDKIGLRQLDISCANANYFDTSGKVIRLIRKSWPHLLIGGASLSIEDANLEIENGNLDMVTWGRAILANPDFVERLQHNKELLDFQDSMRDSLY